MKPTVYLDSSVPSYWLEQDPQDPLLYSRHITTRRWWDEDLSRFDVVISQVVWDEISGGQSERAAKRQNLVKGFRWLAIDDDVKQAAKYYVEQFGMPGKDIRDALHLALASVHDIDYLVTWNFAHLANASKRKHIEGLNRHLHLPTPVICSPEELMLEPLE
jgi:predicted nucleic acid-binding protein